ncbi:MAG: hypothetical protein KY451_14700 [Actinobacteria bacterium]|nr:hypothetical protein [Actinomycetota bacterium]MBW3646340.1 hypothetical protein [Actinomycetota bacterium]
MPDQFVPERILGVLTEHEVQFVLIGGMGAVAHGSPLPTRDVDVTPEASRANLDRLAAALRALDARIRDSDIPEGLAFSCDGTSLAAAIFWNLTTRFGDLDISFTPAGTTGYAGLVVDAEPLTFRGVDVQLASLEAIVRSKAAANRPKDLRALPVLRELLAAQTRARAVRPQP